MTKEQILEEFELLSMPTAGIGAWITPNTADRIFERLGRIEIDPLSHAQLNQLLVLGHEAPVSDGCFTYYWLTAPESHPYEIRDIADFDAAWLTQKTIISLRHLKWGLYRLYVDGLLYYGNIRDAFRALRDLSLHSISAYFQSKAVDVGIISNRGPSIPLIEIERDKRYLISEMACKSYGNVPHTSGDLRTALLEAFKVQGSSPVTVRGLLAAGLTPTTTARQQEFEFSATEVLEETITTEQDLFDKFDKIAGAFFTARTAALQNTYYYLSMVSDLDVYVATSMRNRQDFRDMATTCDTIFADQRLRTLNIRYFDPTLSAAEGHEDKGLIECLMVKCAKALVYCSGDKESYGKDAEAAMALSLGKPVIFYCNQEQKSRFFREVHPLSRLIEFSTGVAVGAIVTDSLSQVSELLHRIFTNKMVYTLEQSKPGYMRLKETLTNSVVRVQTNDRLLTETFWNHYHRKP